MLNRDAVNSPYAPPQALPTAEASSRSRLRWVVFLHAVAVICFAGMTLASKGMLINRDFSEFYLYYGAILLIPALMSWFVCPVVVLLLVARSGTSPSTRVFAVLAEALLWMTQTLVLLPTVQ